MKYLSFKLSDKIKLFIKHRFVLKAGDRVIIRWGKRREIAEVKGFYCYGMYLKDWGVIPFNAGRFYGCGYGNFTDGTKAIYTLKKDWHFIPAKICEWVRLKLPAKIGDWFFM